MDSPNAYARYLKEGRARHGLTQKQIAELLEVTPNTIARWERGELEISKLAFLAIRSIVGPASEPSAQPPPTPPATPTVAPSAPDAATKGRAADIKAAVRKELEKEFGQKYSELQQSFEAVVNAEIKKRIPEAAVAALEKAIQRAQRAEEQVRIFSRRAELCKDAVVLFMENWRSLTVCLHPDRAPEDKREQFSNATDIVLRIKALLAKTPYQEW